MQRNNVILMAAMAVVIAACLLGSFWLSSHDDDGTRDEIVPGDTFEYIMEWNSSWMTENDSFTETVLSISGGTTEVERHINYMTFTYTTDSFVGLGYGPKPGELVPAGTETVSTSNFGDLECDVYTYSNEYYGGTIYVHSTMGFLVMETSSDSLGDTNTIRLWDTTALSDGPETGSCAIGTEVREGDYFSYIQSQEMYSPVVTAIVTDVDDGMVTYSWSDGTSSETVTQNEFLAIGIMSDLPEDDVVGESYLRLDGYGPRTCQMVSCELDGIGCTAYVGTDDGVIYRVVTDEGDTDTLVGSSLVYGRDTAGELREPTVGDEIHVMSFILGDGITDVHTVQYRCTSEGDGNTSYDIRFNWTEDEPGSFEPLVGFYDDMEYIGDETLLINSCQVECAVYSMAVSEDSALYAWVSKEGGFVMKDMYIGDITFGTMIYHTTLFDERPPETGGALVVRDIPKTGDVWTYVGWETDLQTGEMSDKEVTAEVVSVDGKTVIVDVGDERIEAAVGGLGDWLSENCTLDGSYLADYDWCGETHVAMYMYSEGDFYMTLNIGVDDGIVYEIMYFGAEKSGYLSLHYATTVY